MASAIVQETHHMLVITDMNCCNTPKRAQIVENSHQLQPVLMEHLTVTILIHSRLTTIKLR